VAFAGSGLVFNNTYGSGVSTVFKSEIVAAENYLQSQFGNSCTVNCSFDLQNLNPNFSGENFFNPVVVSYSSFVNALKQHATTPTAIAAAASLTNLADPSHGAGFEISIGEARILGLAGAGSGTDDTVILNSLYWTASALQNYPGDAEAVIEHELSEGIMGRIGSLGVADAPYWAPMDLFRFTASGQRDFTGGQDGQLTYFSVNGSTVFTGLQYHNSINSAGQFDGFDLADWDQVGADANAHDPFGPGGPGAGDPGVLSSTDILIMEALGWAPPSNAVIWASGVSGNFAVAANWNPATVPGSSNDVQISPSGTYTITSSANETVNSLTTAVGATLDLVGGTFTINNGTGSGINAGTILVQAGATLVLDGVVSNTGAINVFGGVEYLYGTCSGTTLSSGGVQYDYGTATGTIVGSGSFQDIEIGGTATGTTLSGGIQYDYGTASNTTVNSNSTQAVEAGATATGTTLSGGSQYDYGTASGTIVDSGSQQVIQSGGTASNTTLSGGSEIVVSGATATGAITFMGSGLLTIDHSTGVNSFQLVGFNAPSDKLDLADISYGAQTTIAFSEAADGQSGTLTVSDGTHTAHVTLDGQYVTKDFTLASDGAGGTIIVDPADVSTAALNSSSLVAPTGGTLNDDDPASGPTNSSHNHVAMDYLHGEFSANGGPLLLDTGTAATTADVGPREMASGPLHDLSSTTPADDDSNSTFSASSDAMAGAAVVGSLRTQNLASQTFSFTSDSMGNHTVSVSTPNDGSDLIDRLAFNAVTMTATNGQGSLEPHFDVSSIADTMTKSSDTDTATQPSDAKTTTQFSDATVASGQLSGANNAADQSASIKVGSSNADGFVFKPGLGDDAIAHATSSNAMELAGASSTTNADYFHMHFTEAQPSQPQSLSQAAIANHDTFSLDNHDSSALATVPVLDPHAGYLVAHPPIIG
jgi:autotransporter passenger strand-loop-strand repeat protein